MNEEITVAKAARGDKAAFEQLVLAYEKKVYNMALRYTGDPQDALDISQEVFLRVYRFLPQYRGGSTFSTWLYRITMNVCHDVGAKKTNIYELSIDANTDEDEYKTEIADERYEPEKEYEKKQLRQLISRGIASLDSTYRDVIVMRDINGMSYDAISDALGITEGTVKSRISRAREKLKIFLLKNGNFFAESKSKYNEDKRKEELPN